MLNAWRGLWQGLRAAAAGRAVASLTRSGEGREGLLAGLERALREDPSLRLQLDLMLRGGGGSAAQISSRRSRDGGRDNGSSNVKDGQAHQRS